MRQSLGDVLSSAGNFDADATMSERQAAAALIATHAVLANLRTLQRHADDFFETRHPSNLEEIQKSLSVMADSTLRYSNCLALSILKTGEVTI
jgi:hypothetical protein